MELKDVYVGQLVRVVDTVPTGFNRTTFSVYGEREGTVLRVDRSDCSLQVYIELLDGSETWGRAQDIEPVPTVIKVNCREPNVLQRIWNYLRGIK